MRRGTRADGVVGFERRQGGPRLLFILALILLVGGCGAVPHKSRPDLVLRKDRQTILLMPMDIQLFTITAGGVLKPEAMWTANAGRYVERNITKRLTERAVRVRHPGLEGLLDPDDEQKQNQLIKLHATVGYAILRHQYNPAYKLPGKGDRFDWSLGPEAGFMRDKYGADYALFIYLRDSYASAGRVAFFIVAAALGSIIPMGQQTGFASLVDLHTGRIVWFNRLVRSAGDLRTEAAAARSVELLLKDFPE